MSDEEIIKIWNSRSVNTKQQSYLLYLKGILGNKPLTWNSLDEIAKSGWKGLVCIRSKKGIARGKTEYNRTYEEAKQIVKQWISEGIRKEDITFNQSMPDESLVIQGEIMRLSGGLYLHGSFVKKPMNQALAEKSFDVQGSAVLYLLNKHLFAQSLVDLYHLLDQFPDNAIEFSTYSIHVGDLPGRNTVFWEVRNY
jgi:hypothetical protein